MPLLLQRTGTVRLMALALLLQARPLVDEGSDPFGVRHVPLIEVGCMFLEVGDPAVARCQLAFEVARVVARAAEIPFEVEHFELDGYAVLSLDLRPAE